LTPEEFLERFVAMIQVQPAEPKQTSMFVKTKHEELCLAFSCWFNQLLLLFGDVVQVAITQSLHDDGVDIVVEQLSTKKRMGLQIKSHYDISEKTFHQKIMAQIAVSKKHDLMKLFVILCADLTDQEQLDRTRGLISELSEMDDYAVPITPEKAVIVLDAFRRNEHPLSFIKGTKAIATMIEGLSRALSSDHYDATVTVKLESKESKESGSAQGTLGISFVPGASAIRALDMVRVVETGVAVTIPGESIEKITLLDKDGKELVPRGAKVDYLKIIPEVARLLPMKMATTDPSSGHTISIEHVEFLREKFDGLHLLLASDGHPKALLWHLDLDFEKKTSHLTYDFYPEDAPISAGLEFARFVTAMSQSRDLTVSLESDGSLVGRFPVSEASIEEQELRYLLELLEDLSFIESKTGVKFTVPVSATRWDLDMAKSVRKLLTEGYVDLDQYSFRMTLTAGSERAIEMLEKTGFLTDVVSNVKDLQTELFGKRFSLGPARYETPAARCLNDLSDVKEQFKKAGTITLDMTSSTGKKTRLSLG